MSLLLNRAKMTTTTTGTGTVTLGEAVSPYQSFSAAGAQNSATYPYLIEDVNGAWEIGFGVYTSSGTTFSRTLTASSTAALLNLSGLATVSITARQEDLSIDAARIDTAETLPSVTAYVDLATVGPAVTLLTGTSALLWFGCETFRTGAGSTSFVSVAVSGATTIAAADANACMSAYPISVAYVCLAKSGMLLTGLTAGVNTFTMKYRNDTSTTGVNFANRTLCVQSRF